MRIKYYNCVIQHCMSLICFYTKNKKQQKKGGNIIKAHLLGSLSFIFYIVYVQ